MLTVSGEAVLMHKHTQEHFYLHWVTRMVNMVYADKVPKVTAANCPPHL